MSTVFWVATIAMALLAFSFAATPLIRTNRRFGIVGFAVALPVFAGSMYWLVGSPQAASVSTVEKTSTQNHRDTTSRSAESVGSVASMVDGLAERLKEHPDDGQGWLLLARSYHHLERFTEAQQAYEQATAHSEYDENLATFSGSQFPAESSSAQVFGNLRLSDKSKAIVLPTDTVFIFARAVGGPSRPVAVLQRSASDLPLNFLLNDSQSMSAETKLSNYAQVIVTARISRSGVATDALQDLEASSESIVVAENRHLDMVID